MNKQTAAKTIRTAQQETATAEALQQFPRILAELRKEAAEQFASRCEWMGKRPETVKNFLTALQWRKYQNGEKTKAETIATAQKKALSEVLKIFINKVKKVNRIAEAEPTTWASVSVEWHKSRTWGNNPTAKTATGKGYYIGTASGCGYDKESAAIAETLNAAPEVLKILYIAEEKRLKARHRKERREAIGYGSGYGAAPYFEGGVGVSSYYGIFKACGYEMRNTGSGDRFDVYQITKAGKR